MSDEPKTADANPPPQQNPAVDSNSSADAASKTPAAPAASSGNDLASTGSEGQKAAALTSEEQWALFEKELKENDWGHQPC
jgi:hypothetical protein